MIRERLEHFFLLAMSPVLGDRDAITQHFGIGASDQVVGVAANEGIVKAKTIKYQASIMFLKKSWNDEVVAIFKVQYLSAIILDLAVASQDLCRYIPWCIRSYTSLGLRAIKMPSYTFVVPGH